MKIAHAATTPRDATADGLPTWPPLLAARGPGGLSAAHAHHAMHLVLGLDGALRVRGPGAAGWSEAAGVLTAPDVAHAIDARGRQIALVFVDPESDVGGALCATLTTPVRLLTAAERDALLEGADAARLHGADGVAWTHRVVATLGSGPLAPRPPVHPRVRKLLRLLRAMPPDGDTALPALADAVGLSPGRLMHAFTASIGIPLRPYLAWLRLQRACAAIVAGEPLSRAASGAGFSDAAHMTRTFRRMLGMPPSALRPESSPPRRA